MSVPALWQSVRLHLVLADIQPGFAQSPNAENVGVAQLRTNNVSAEGRIDLSELKYVSVSAGDLDKYSIQRGDVIFNNTNSLDLVGKTACFDLEGEFVFSNHMTRLRVDEALIDSEYLARYLHYLWQIGFSRHRAKQWVSQAAIDQEGLAQFEIPLPSLSEQRRIVAVLREADYLRLLRREADTLVANLISALFKRTFLEEPEGARTQTYISLGEVITFITSGGRGWARYYSTSGGKFIRVQDVLENELNLNENQYVSPPDGAEKIRTAIQPGDLLISITGTIGCAAIAPDNIGEAYVSQHVALVRLDGSISPQFVAAFINHPDGGKRQIEQMNYGQVKPGLNLDQVRSLQIPRPSNDQLISFEAQLEMIREVKNSCDLSESFLNELYDSVSSNAFTGELTATWREQRQRELLAEAAARDEALAQRGQHRRRVVEITVGEAMTAEVMEAFTQEVSRGIGAIAQAVAADPAGIALRAMERMRPLVELGELVKPIMETQAPLVDTSLLQGVMALGREEQRALAEALEPVRRATTELAESITAPLLARLAETVARVSLAPDEDDPRYQLLRELRRDATQYGIYLRALAEPGHFTAQRLAQQHQLAEETVRRTLELLAANGLIAQVQVVASTDGRDAYLVPAYRRLRPEQEVRGTEFAWRDGEGGV